MNAIRARLVIEPYIPIFRSDEGRLPFESDPQSILSGYSGVLRTCSRVKPHPPFFTLSESKLCHFSSLYNNFDAEGKKPLHSHQIITKISPHLGSCRETAPSKYRPISVGRRSRYSPRAVQKPHKFNVTSTDSRPTTFQGIAP